MCSLRGTLVTERFSHDGGRRAKAYVPLEPPDAVVYAADGDWHLERLARALEDAGERTTMVVGVHGLDDDDGRLHEYVEAFGGERFEAFERFFVEDVTAWSSSGLGVAVAAGRTAVWGASLGGELALAVGLRHPETYGIVLCASPGGGFTPASAELPDEVPRSYLVAGTQEPWFLDNARRWADALGAIGADVVIEERNGDHGGEFWYQELPLMVSWAFGP
ncbi:MAG: alpha/beta hydrolase-fold protein [Actinomycetota bacterium]|nr:alpha/beta hydrolase-fold protein [Actinomycetota bacterium]